MTANAVRIVPLTAALLGLLPLAPGCLQAIAGDPYFVEAATVRSVSFAMVESGYVIGAGGVMRQWPGRATAWLLTGIWARPRHLVLAHRFARRWLDELQQDPAFRRVECTVKSEFEAGRRFARRLGFRLEAMLGCFDPDGDDHVSLARIAP